MTNEEALNAITAFVENYACGSDLDGLREAIEVLKERPHGEWETNTIINKRTGEKEIYSFCPCCGASYLREGESE